MVNSRTNASLRKLKNIVTQSTRCYIHTCISICSFLNIYQTQFSFLKIFCHTNTCGILVPRPGTSHLSPLQWKWSLSPWTTEEVLINFVYVCELSCAVGSNSLPGSSVHGIFQARILKWGAISSSRGSS